MNSHITELDSYNGIRVTSEIDSDLDIIIKAWDQDVQIFTMICSQKDLKNTVLKVKEYINFYLKTNPICLAKVDEINKAINSLLKD